MRHNDHSLGCPVQSDVVWWAAPPWSHEPIAAASFPVPAKVWAMRHLKVVQERTQLNTWILVTSSVRVKARFKAKTWQKFHGKRPGSSRGAATALSAQIQAGFAVCSAPSKELLLLNAENLQLDRKLLHNWVSRFLPKLTSLRRSCSRSWYLTTLRLRNLRTS